MTDDGSDSGSPDSGSPDSGSPGRPRRVRWPLIATAAVVGSVLSVGGTVVWNASDGPAYTALPDCSGLLPPEVMAGVPGLADAEPVTGGSTEDSQDPQGGESGPATGPGVLDTLNCEARTEEGDADRLTLAATLYAPDAVEDMRTSVDTVREGYARNQPGDPSVHSFGDKAPRLTDWRMVDAGDGGFATFTRAADEDPGQDGRSWASATYVTEDIRVVVVHFAGETVSESEGLDVVERLADETAERMS